jgi:hypothetical protein
MENETLLAPTTSTADEKSKHGYPFLLYFTDLYVK